MEQGRSFGGYVKLLAGQGMFRLRNELLGVKGLLALLIAAYVLIDMMGAMESARSLMGLGLSVLWMVLLFPPRMGKLLYLLPFSKKERWHYLRTYLVTYVAFLVAIYFLLGLGTCLISDFSFLRWLKIFVFSICPFLLLLCGITISCVAVQKEPREANTLFTNFYSTRGCWYQERDTVAEIREDCKCEIKPQKKRWKELNLEERIIRKNEIWLNTLAVVSFIAAAFQIYLCPIIWGLRWEESHWFWIGSGVFYICAIVCGRIFWNRVLEEINKRGSTGKEESECNS